VGSSWNRFAFTGYEEDTETNLLYAKARFYDPDTGRFLSHDAWEGDRMMPPSLHKYLYVYQNPTVWWDPTGNSPIYSWQDESGQRHYTDNVQAARNAGVAEAFSTEQSTSAGEVAALMYQNRNPDAPYSVNTDDTSVRGITHRIIPKKTSIAIVVESNGELAPGSVELFMEEYLQQRARYARGVKDVANTTAMAADIVSGIVNPLKGGFDTVQMVRDIPEMYRNFDSEVAFEVTKQLLERAAENPEYVAAASAAIVACKFKCGGLQNKFDDLAGRAGSENIIPDWSQNLRFWKKPRVMGNDQVGFRRVFQRDDLFDPYLVIDGKSNIERMQKGRPPVGFDNEPVNLHHLIQKEPGTLVEAGG
jgi:RHS repeat-associated protein